MAMTKPTALAKTAYDSTTASMFYFTTSGGNQVVKNRITIRNNSTNVVVYQNTVESFLFQQEVPANTLTNGIYYNYYFNTYDIDNNISPDSNSVAFYCYSTPTITLTNAPSTNKIESTSYAFSCVYNQTEGELLDYLIYYLYDANGIELSNSGRLYSSITPPISFTYTFSGFNDSTDYKIQVKAVSVNGTQTQSELYEFEVSYIQPNVFSLLVLENKPDDGYVNIRSNVVLTEGIVSPLPPLFRSDIMTGNPADYIQWDEWYIPTNDVISIWTERYALELTDLSKTLTFSNGFDIPSSFQYQLWQKPCTDGVIGYIYNSAISTNKMTITMKSGIPSGESTVKNWFELTTDDGNLFDYSNYVDAMNLDSRFIIWIKKVGTTYTLLLDVISVGSGGSISWAGTATYPTAKIHNNIDSIFPLNTVKLRNGVYDNLDITSNTDRVYSQSFPTWDYYTRLNCDFSNLDAGNLDVALSQLQSVRLKRRPKDGFDWITLYDIPVSSVEDLNITKRDAIVPTGEEFEYAIVLVMAGGVEGTYIIQDITTCFRWCYLCDNDTILKFYSNCGYPTITSNPTGGVFAPIGRAKPITVYNSNNQYETGTFSGEVLGSQFINTRKIDRKDIQTTLKSYKSFINNKKPKILKDWDGRIKIVDTNTESGLAESVNLVSGTANLALSWVEKGDYDSQQDLYDNGLVDTL